MGVGWHTPVCFGDFSEWVSPQMTWSITDLVNRGLHQAVQVLAEAALSLQICNMTTFLWVLVHLWAECLFRWRNRLVVASEYFALLSNDWHLSDVLLGGLASALATGRWRSPKHRIRVLGVRGHVRDVRSTHILVETVHSILEVSWVLVVSSWWLVGPEATWLPGAEIIVLESALPLDEWPKADLAELLI